MNIIACLFTSPLSTLWRQTNRIGNTAFSASISAENNNKKKYNYIYVCIGCKQLRWYTLTYLSWNLDIKIFKVVFRNNKNINNYVGKYIVDTNVVYLNLTVPISLFCIKHLAWKYA